MATIIDTGLSAAGLRSEFFDKYAEVPTAWESWVTRIVSTKDQETYKWLGSMALPTEWGTGRVPVGLRSETYNVVNREYALTIEVARTEIEDDQTSQIKLRVAQMAQHAAKLRPSLLSQLLINGGTAGNTSYDGVTFFNDAHVSGASGSQDNNLTYDASSATAPTVAEFKAALEQAVAAMMGFKDDNGIPQFMDTSGLVVVVPPSTYLTAREAVGAAVIGNTTNVNQGLADVQVFHFLTDATVWYLLKTTGTVIRPFILQERMPLEFTALDNPESEAVFRQGKYLYGTRERLTMAYGEWRCAVKTTWT